MKKFDLNIEQVLEHWGLEHALREVIANAIDEQILTKSPDIEIFQDSNNRWHIRDYGRGLNYVHFTQNENKEKLESQNLIGKFGVGLKDALAVFNRHNVDVEINSKYACITLQVTTKSEFDIETLHAKFDEPKDNGMKGTEFIISGVSADNIDKAKNMFLRFGDSKLLEETKYGDVYSKQNDLAFIYINGVQVAQEDNFMFSYNITNISSQIKKALNRERTNVGRNVYSDRVKKILTQCKCKEVLTTLVQDIDRVMEGTNKDESSWIEVATYAVKVLGREKEIVIVTTDEIRDFTNKEREMLNDDHREVIVVPDNVKEKLGNSVPTFADVKIGYNNSFEYKFVPYKNLSIKEKSIFDTKSIVIGFLKRYKYKHDVQICISETIRIDEYGKSTEGVFIRNENKIIIKRTALLETSRFLGVLIHEFAHYISEASDNTREFENMLTEMLGHSMNDMIKN